MKCNTISLHSRSRVETACAGDDSALLAELPDRT